MADDPINQFHAKMKDFYAEYQEHENIFRFNEALATGREAAIGYAQMGIKYLIIINGGSLFAIPAIVQAFGMEINSQLITAASFFALGLVAIFLCLFCAYYSVIEMIASISHERVKNYSIFAIRHLKSLYSEEILSDMRSDESKNETERATYERRSGIWENIAVGLFIASMCSFIAGSAFLILSIN